MPDTFNIWTTIVTNSNTYLVGMTNGDGGADVINIWDVSSLSTTPPILVMSSAWTVFGNNNLTAATSINGLLYVAMSYTTSGPNTPTVIYNVGLNLGNPTTLTFQDTQIGTGSWLGPSPNPNLGGFNLLCGNAALNELYIAKDAQTIHTYNTGSNTHTGTFKLSGAAQICNYLYNYPTTTFKMFWNALTVTGASGVISHIAESPNTPGLYYAVGFNDSLVYSGSISGNTLALTRFSAIAASTYSIQTATGGQTTYDSYAYNYKLSTQALVAQYHAANLYISGIGKNTITNEYAMAISNGTVLIFNATTLAITETYNIAGAYSVALKDGQDIDAGFLPIYNYSNTGQG